MNEQDSRDALSFFLSEEEWEERHKAREKKDREDFTALGEKYLGKPLRELGESLDKLNNLKTR
jgi:hypothetical protein